MDEFSSSNSIIKDAMVVSDRVIPYSCKTQAALIPTEAELIC